MPATHAAHQVCVLCTAAPLICIVEKLRRFTITCYEKPPPANVDPGPDSFGLQQIVDAVRSCRLCSLERPCYTTARRRPAEVAGIRRSLGYQLRTPRRPRSGSAIEGRCRLCHPGQPEEAGVLYLVRHARDGGWSSGQCGRQTVYGTLGGKQRERRRLPVGLAPRCQRTRHLFRPRRHGIYGCRPYRDTARNAQSPRLAEIQIRQSVILITHSSDPLCWPYTNPPGQ